MLRFVPAPIVGSLAFIAFVLNTLFWIPFLMATALVRLAVPLPPVVRACRRAAEFIASTWVSFNIKGLRVVGKTEWDVTRPAGLRRDGCYVVTCNHRSWVDIVVVQWVFHRHIPFVKFFLKKELFRVPLLGLAWWALEFPFMQRHPRAVLEQRPDLRRQDLRDDEASLRTIPRASRVPAELRGGHTFSDEKRVRQGSSFRHLLLPRAGGIAQVVSTLGDRLDGLLDVTIAYPGGTPTFWDLISGRIPRVTVHIAHVPLDPAWTGRDYLSDSDFRAAFQAFLRDLWTEKDVRLGTMLAAAAAAGGGEVHR